MYSQGYTGRTSSTFYEEELQLSVQKMFRIEQVLRKKKKQAFVKWKGYSYVFNSWIPLTHIKDEYQ